MVGEGPHGNEQGHAFRLALIRDRRFAASVNDIVVEFGSARYQDLMDRFVNGGDVPAQELRRAWQDTTVTTAVWDRPIYEEFFRAVRDVNAALPPGRRLRVLLGDAPIDQFDALLHLGSRESLTMSTLPRSLCADDDYVKTRLARLAFSVPQARAGFTDSFRAACSLPAAMKQQGAMPKHRAR